MVYRCFDQSAGPGHIVLHRCKRISLDKWHMLKRSRVKNDLRPVSRKNLNQQVRVRDAAQQRCMRGQLTQVLHGHIELIEISLAGFQEH